MDFPVSLEEMSEKMSAVQYIEWAKRKSDEISTEDKWVEACRFNQCKEAKKFVEETSPLKAFLEKKFSGRSDIYIKHNTDSRSFDAELFGVQSSSSLQYLEITNASADADNVSRMKVLAREGSVSSFGRVTKIGTDRKGAQISVEIRACDPREIHEECFAKIESAVLSKCKKSSRYPENTGLIVFLEDNIFAYGHEQEWLDGMIKSKVIEKIDGFTWLFIVGHFGRVFFEYALASAPREAQVPSI
jgi:hypothetical protein